MKIAAILTALLSLILTGTSGTTPHHAGIVIRNVSIIDVRTGAIDRTSDVMISGDRIQSVGKNLKVGKDATVVDGTGKFLIPGLWDMHVHALRNDRSDPFFKLFIANGVTGVRDMGTTADAFAALPQLRAD